MLQSLAQKVEDNAPTHTAVEAISRHYMSQMGDSALKWYVAKMDVRKIVLQGSKAPEAVVLLESNMWESSIFCKATVKKLIESDTPPWSLGKRLGLSSPKNKFWSQNPTRVNPDKLGKDSKEHEFFPGNSTPNTQTNTNDLRFMLQNTNRKQFQSIQNRKGTQYQNSGTMHQPQRTNKGATVKQKPWNKRKPNPKGGSGFTGTTKGNKSTQ